MLVRFSKYDFWIPEQILDFSIFFPKIKYIFSKSKKNLEKVRKIFFRDQTISEKKNIEKSMKIQNFEFSIFSQKNQNFKISNFH